MNSLLRTATLVAWTIVRPIGFYSPIIVTAHFDITGLNPRVVLAMTHSGDRGFYSIDRHPVLVANVSGA